MTLSELLFVSALLLASAIQTQNGKPPVTAPPPASGLGPVPPIKMGLWEATITSAAGTTMKTRSCMTQQSYQEQVAHIPAHCTLANVSRTPTHISGDISCKSPNGTAASSGHFDAEFPDVSTVQSTVSLDINVQGHSMPMTIKTQSHYIGADCGGISPGQAQIVH